MQIRLTQDRQGVLPWPAFWASTKPFGTPLGPYFIKWAVTIIMILAPPAGDAFNFSQFSSFKPSLDLNADAPCSHGSPSLSCLSFQLVDGGGIIHSSLPSQKTECAAIRLPHMGRNCHLQHHCQFIPYHNAVVSTSDRARRRRRHILVCDVRGDWNFNVSKHCLIG
jgi:hypothetical protein